MRHWCKGGTTCLANGMLLCAFHHHAVHEGGYRIEPSAGPGARWVFLRPDGTVVPAAPPALPATDASAVAAQSRQLDLDIGPRTALPYWAGEHLDLGLALDALFSPGEVRLAGVTGSPPSTGTAG